jgi:hypothetical protein
MAKAALVVYKWGDMPYHNIRRKKRNLSEHQKRIRFLTGLSIFMVFAFMVTIFWIANRSSFGHH